MYHKLSNTAQLSCIEKKFGVTFEYPHLYKPQVVVNGLKETNVNIITTEHPDKVSISIWGLLPEDYIDDWATYQKVANTLYTDEDAIASNPSYSCSLKKKRCLFIVTGFYVSYLKNGKLHPYHIGLKNGAPFFLAGVYNTLNDGFITSSLLVNNVDNSIKQFNNISARMPIIIPSEISKLYLDSALPLEHLKLLLKEERTHEIQATPADAFIFKQKPDFQKPIPTYGPNSSWADY